jgi:hypothetical protein
MSTEPTFLTIVTTSSRTEQFVVLDWGRAVSVMRRRNEAPVDNGVLELETHQVLKHEGCPNLWYSQFCDCL